LGDSLLRNAAEIRFFDGSSTGKYNEPLDPTNYSSPIITKFSQKRELEFENLTANFDKNTIDNDSIMCRLLQNPKPFLDLLEHIYKHVLKNIQCDNYVEQWDIRGTRTWEALQMLFKYNEPECPYN
jgi:hypothetical protein